MNLSAMPKAFSSHHSWYLATLDSVSDQTRLSTTPTTANNPTSSPLSKLIYVYSNVLHGFSANLSPSELEAIKNSPGYVSSIRDLPVVHDTTHSSHFLGLNAEYGAWPKSGYGKDVIIGVVDSGIWPESKSFSDDGMSEIPSRWRGYCESGTQFNSSMCNKKLIGARTFKKGLLASDPTLIISMNSIRDTEGHGTHTSTIAAGNYVDGASYFGYAPGTARGMAPRARLAVYKDSWQEGSFTSDSLAAIDQAIADGVDILSLSFGFRHTPLYEDVIAIATFAAMEKDIFVSTSAGNRGPDIKMLSNATPWVLTVAAGTIDRQFSGIVTLGNGVSITGLSLYPGNSTSSQLPIIYKNSCENVEELKKVGHKIVVCQDVPDLFYDTFSEQINNVRNAGAAGGVFITNDTELRGIIQSEFPAVFLTPQTGEVILDYIKSSSKPRAILNFQETRLGTKPAPRVATYSSRGPSRSCPFVMKPDLMAPGSLILASWPLNRTVTTVNSVELFSNFDILSGTSMAAPHAAGVAALLKGVHPEWSHAAIRSAMMTTSYVLDNTLQPIKDFDNEPVSPIAIGAGHINPNKALDPGLIYDVKAEDYFNILCALNFTANQIYTITRSSSYKCSNPSLDLNYPSFIAYFNDRDNDDNAKIVQEFRRTVTNVGDGRSIYSVKLTTIEGLNISVVPDKLIFMKKYEKKSYKLSIEGPRLLNVSVAYGSLTWVDLGGKHVVRSPIVATNFNSAILPDE